MSAILLENGSRALIESGGVLLLEDLVVAPAVPLRVGLTSPHEMVALTSPSQRLGRTNPQVTHG